MDYNGFSFAKNPTVEEYKTSGALCVDFYGREKTKAFVWKRPLRSRVWDTENAAVWKVRQRERERENKKN